MSEILKPTVDIFPELKEIPGILRIGIDLDGVAADIGPAVRVMVLEGLGIDVVEAAKGKDTTEYWLHKWPEIKAIPGGPEFILDMWHKPALYEKAEQIPGAVDSITEWRALGYQIWFVSARDKDSVGKATLTWLERNGLWWASKENRVLFPQSPNEERISFKSRIAQELALHVFIEDYANILKNLNSLSLMVKILLKHSYNIGEDAGSQVKRADSWSEIAAVVQEASRWHYHVVSHNS